MLAPDYRRDLHEPVAASLPIEIDGVVITEGNYLGLELPGWADVRGLIDLLVYIDTPFEELASRLIDRHVSFGRDRADAAHWVRTVDAANMAPGGAHEGPGGPNPVAVGPAPPDPRRGIAPLP